MSLMSVIDKVEPEVAKTLINQIPEAVKCTIETEKVYMDLLEKALDSGCEGTAACLSKESDFEKAIYKELASEDVTFEEKKYESVSSFV